MSVLLFLFKKIIRTFKFSILVSNVLRINFVISCQNSSKMLQQRFFEILPLNTINWDSFLSLYFLDGTLKPLAPIISPKPYGSFQV